MDFLGVLCCAVELCSLCRISMTGIEPRTTYVKQRWFELMIMQTLNRRASYLKYNCNLECIILRQRVYLCDFQWICQSLKCQIGTNTNEMRCSVTYRRCLEFKKNDFKIYFTIQIENRWCARVRVSSFPPANRIPNDMGDNANKHVLDILMIANGNLNLDICTDWITLNLHVVMYSNRLCELHKFHSKVNWNSNVEKKVVESCQKSGAWLNCRRVVDCIQTNRLIACLKLIYI